MSIWVVCIVLTMMFVRQLLYVQSQSQTPENLNTAVSTAGPQLQAVLEQVNEIIILNNDQCGTISPKNNTTEVTGKIEETILEQYFNKE